MNAVMILTDRVSVSVILYGVVGCDMYGINRISVECVPESNKEILRVEMTDEDASPLSPLSPLSPFKGRVAPAGLAAQ